MNTPKTRKETKTAQKPYIYRPSECARVVGIGRSTLYAWEAQGRFPKRVNLAGNVAGWLVSDVEAWLSSKVEAAA